MEVEISWLASQPKEVEVYYQKMDSLQLVNRLKSQGKLGGVFVWSADNSKASGFKYEKQSQALLATRHKNFSV